MSSEPDGYVAEPPSGGAIALLLIIGVVVAVLAWFGANVMTTLAASCGGG